MQQHSSTVLKVYCTVETAWTLEYCYSPSAIPLVLAAFATPQLAVEPLAPLLLSLAMVVIQNS